MVVGYSLAHSIVQPVLRLRRVAQAAEQADLSQRTGMPARDELGENGGGGGGGGHHDGGDGGGHGHHGDGG